MGLDELAEKKAQLACDEGDYHAGVTTLMNAYGRQILNFCATTLNDENGAHDVLQVVFVQAFQALEKFDRKSTYRTWLYSIARHRCLDTLKSKRRLEARVDFVSEPPDTEVDSATEESDSLEQRILHECLGKLDQETRTAILLRFQASYSYAELAQIIHQKAGTLQARVTRALPRLRRCIEDNGVTL